MPKTSINCHIKKYAYCDIEQIYKEIDTSPNGLTYDRILSLTVVHIKTLQKY